MASVRITNDMRYAVDAKLNAMYTERLQKIEEEITKLPLGRETALANIDPADLELAYKLNRHRTRKWVTETNSIQIKLIFTNSRNGKDTDARTVAIDPTIPVPTDFYRIQFQVKESQPSYAKYLELANTRSDTLYEQQELRERIRGLMNHCTTLVQLLEAWPSALDYIPTQYRERHYEKVEKKEKREAAVVDDETKLLLFKANLLKN